MSIAHLIITRFNIQYEPEDTIGIQYQWLDERLRLFEQYCLPSVEHQTCNHFTWIILGDSRTPKEYKARIKAYVSRVPQICLYWTSYQADGYHSLYRQIGRKYAEGKDILISTRLDNDDALAPNYIATVQQIALDGTEGIVSFPIGRQTFVKERKSYTLRYVPNHSTSRIERSVFGTIMEYDHTRVAVSRAHIIETKEPMWEEIVHGGNVCNDYVPKYHYYIHSISDAIDLTTRWIRFQTKRVIRLLKSIFVGSNNA